MRDFTAKLDVALLIEADRTSTELWAEVDRLAKIGELDEKLLGILADALEDASDQLTQKVRWLANHVYYPLTRHGSSDPLAQNVRFGGLVIWASAAYAAPSGLSRDRRLPTPSVEIPDGTREPWVVPHDLMSGLVTAGGTPERLVNVIDVSFPTASLAIKAICRQVPFRAWHHTDGDGS